MVQCHSQLCPLGILISLSYFSYIYAFPSLKLDACNHRICFLKIPPFLTPSHMVGFRPISCKGSRQEKKAD